MRVISIADGFDLEFSTGSIHDFVRVVNLSYELSEFTLSLWIKSDANRRNSHPSLFSYATEKGGENTILVMDYSKHPYTQVLGSELKYNNHIISDGRWHQVAVTWENKFGTVSLYADGIALTTKTGVGIGDTLSSNGVVYLAQDQDSVDGDLDAAQSYIGVLTEVHIWNRTFTSQEIAGLKTNCLYGEEGNILSWYKTFLSSINGNVAVHSPSSCK